MSKKVFHLEFEDESAAASGTRHDGLSYECSDEGDECLKVEVLDGVPFIIGNRSAFLTLARVLAKFGLSEYKDDFHIHLRKDFSDDAALPDALTIYLKNSN
jgi:hypothetical protein